MTSVSEYVSRLLPRIRDILQDSDLSTISAKSVRKALIAEGEDEALIKANRNEIDERIGEIYEALCDGDDAEASSDDTPLASSSQAPRAGSDFVPPSSQPEPLHKPKTERKPKMERDGGGGQVESDAAMAARMQAEYDSLTRGGRGQRAVSSTTGKKGSNKVKKSSKTKSKKRSASDVDSDAGDDEKPKKKRAGGGGGAFNKELILSDALAAFTQETRLSRPQTVKRIWEYVKARDLQDPSDKRFIRCDDAMKLVFHTDRLHMFTMNKLLAHHFRDPDEII